MKQIISVFRLIRFHNCLIAAIGTWLGGYLAGVEPESARLMAAMISVALLCAAGNAQNDFFDLEADRINNPKRILPNGDLPLYMAVLLSIVFYLSGLALAVWIGWAAAIFSIIAIILLNVYNMKFMKMPIWGNLIVAMMGGLVIMFGTAAGEYARMFIIPGAVIPALFAVLFHFGREIIKDLGDIEGDKKAGYKVITDTMGGKSSLLIISITFTALIFVTFLPLYYKWYGPFYGYIAFLAVDLPLAITIVYLWRSVNPLKYKKSAGIIKILMFLGLIAFFLGKF